MRGAATQAMSDVVEERQQRRCPSAAAPLRAAARRPAGIVARSSHTALGIARRSRLASGPGGLQQNANLFLREPLESAAASMNGFWYRKKRLYCEQVSVAKAAATVGTPFYLYSQAALERNFQVFDSSFREIPHLTCYAIKANSNIAILRVFRSLGAGFDIVSGGELFRALKAGADPQKLVFSGVGKAQEEIDLALKHRILLFNVESAAEMKMLEERARSVRKVAQVSLRVNPDVDPRTHPYIATGLRQHKFGVPMEDAAELYRIASRSRHLRIGGIGCHIGSQITRLEPFVDAVKKLKGLVAALSASGIHIRHLDLGGGLGISYNDEDPPPPEAYAKAICEIVKDMECTVLLEPGRVIVGSAAILVTRVLLTKQNGSKNFIVVDAGMNDLLRPSLYGSYHAIQPERVNGRGLWKADVVGPVCESGDFLARDREIQIPKKGDLLAVMNAGAYGMVLASNYNSRPRAAEVIVKERRMKVIRRREGFIDLVRGEAVNPL